jgi:hypothetical protein
MARNHRAMMSAREVMKNGETPELLADVIGAYMKETGGPAAGHPAFAVAYGLHGSWHLTFRYQAKEIEIIGSEDGAWTRYERHDDPQRHRIEGWTPERNSDGA